MTKDSESGRKTHPGLQLDLPGAPPAYHEVVGLPGLYHPDHPTPVGGIGEASEEQARHAASADGVPVKAVRIPDSMLVQRRREASDARRLESGLSSREEEE